MSKDFAPSCATCPLPLKDRVCVREGGKHPAGCPTARFTDIRDAGLEAMQNDPALLRFARESAWVESAGYTHKDSIPRPARPRIAEIIDFARRMDYTRLGLIFCMGLRNEAAVTVKILEANDFEVISVICKIGGVPKSALGLPPEGQLNARCPESMCNPIMQAEVCNEVGVDFNILLGLCVGHDTLALQTLKAPATVFAVKDRLLGHNPLAALYTADGYYRYLNKPFED